MAFAFTDPTVMLPGPERIKENASDLISAQSRLPTPMNDIDLISFMVTW